MKPNILAVIPARAGSKGVPRKNILTIGGVSLLGHAIRSANESTYQIRTIVSTECDELRAEALLHGAEVPFQRPKELATDTASTWDVMRHAVEWLEENEGWVTDILVILQPTTPFRRGEHIDAILKEMEQTNTSVCMTVKQTDYPPQWMFHRKDDGGLSPIIEGTWPKRRQDAVPVFQPNGMVYAIKRSRLSEDEPTLVSDVRSILVDSDISINIDEWIHFDLAKLTWDRLNDL